MRTRVALLGASNLTRSLPRVVATARAVAGGGPIEVLAALGHGRSYGLRSRVLARTLPGILECGIWTALDRAPESGRTLALLTDVGNDIVYGVPAPTIIEWVEACVARLEGPGVRIVLTQLPLASIRRTGPLRFLLARTLLFPRHSITRRQVLDRSADVASGLEAIAGRRGLELAPLPAEWYGVDPIHIRRGRAREAWPRIMAGWTASPTAAPPAVGAPARSEARAIGRARAERRWLFGRPRATSQPAARLPDGTTVSLY